jgi:hypothetical protein
MSNPREVIATELARIAIVNELAPLSHDADGIIFALFAAGFVIEPAWRPIDDGAKDGEDCLLETIWHTCVVASWDSARWDTADGYRYSDDQILSYKPLPALPEVK